MTPLSSTSPATYRTSGSDPAGPAQRPSWDLIALLAMAVIGLGISIYLTSVHYANTALVCSASSVVDCQQVTKSVYSMVGTTGIPITVPGMAWFVVSGGLAAAAWYWRAQSSGFLLRLAAAHALWSAMGLLFVLYLVYAELVRLHKICEWCTGVHILTLLTFLVALYRLLRLLLPEEVPESEAGAYSTNNGRSDVPPR